MADKTKSKKPTLFFLNKESEPLFSKKNRVLLTDPFDDNNPITVQVMVSVRPWQLQFSSNQHWL